MHRDKKEGWKAMQHRPVEHIALAANSGTTLFAQDTLSFEFVNCLER